MSPSVSFSLKRSCFPGQVSSFVSTSGNYLRNGTLRPARGFSSSIKLPQKDDQKLYDGDLRSLHNRFDLSKRNFLVTGGARGIGYSIVRAIAEMGGNVCVWDRAQKPVADFSSLADEFGVKTSYIQADVSDMQSLRSAFKQTMTEFAQLDGWCVRETSYCNHH